MRNARAVAIVALCMAVGCGLLFGRVSYTEMPARLEYAGFSLPRPPNTHWYSLREEQTRQRVLLHRELQPQSRTHSFYVGVGLGAIDRAPTSHEDFAELARNEEQEAPYLVTTDSYTQELTTRQGYWCIRYASTHTVYGAPVAPETGLKMSLEGLRCRHPKSDRAILIAICSERGQPNELQTELWNECEVILDGVRIDG